MPESISSPEETLANVQEFTVSELSFMLKRTIEDAYGHVRVRGEIGRVSRPGSGHIYLDLKDDKAVLSGIIWKGVANTLAVKPEQGLEVICTGRLTTFPGQSRYQIVIERMAPAGVGALMALLEERKKKLAAEGLFAPERKKPLPYLPDVIGVVTSPSGAVIRDILHRLSERFPRRVLVWPVRVQGEQSAAEVAAAIIGFNRLKPGGAIPRPDLLIVARGGGSVEDLWSFNEEIVVRAAAASDIPLISAVGHETDTTLIDFAADRRAPTPTAAAEIAVPVRAELLDAVFDFARRLMRAETRAISDRRARLDGLARGLPRLTDLLALPRQRFDHAAARLGQTLSRAVSDRRARLDGLARGLPRLTDLLALPRQRVDHAAARLGQALSRAVSDRRARIAGPAARLSAHLVGARMAQDRRAVREAAARLSQALRHAAQAKRTHLIGMAVRVSAQPILAKIGHEQLYLDELSARLVRAQARHRRDLGRRLEETGKLLTSYSYENVLERGFALVHGPKGKPVRNSRETAPGQALTVEFAGKDYLGVTVSGAPARRDPAKPAKVPKKKKSAQEQGSLL